MVKPEDHVRNPICFQAMNSGDDSEFDDLINDYIEGDGKKGCTKELEGFAFKNGEDEHECIKHTACVPTKNFFKTMNQCRKTCHYGIAEERPRGINKKKAFRHVK